MAPFSTRGVNDCLRRVPAGHDRVVIGIAPIAGLLRASRGISVRRETVIRRKKKRLNIGHLKGRTLARLAVLPSWTFEKGIKTWL